MNRRSFFKTLLPALAGFAILPSAKTYRRVWRSAGPLMVPIWEVTYEVGDQVIRKKLSRVEAGKWVTISKKPRVITGSTHLEEHLLELPIPGDGPWVGPQSGFATITIQQPTVRNIHIQMSIEHDPPTSKEGQPVDTPGAGAYQQIQDLPVVQIG
jgi:hypothetical protein